MLYKYYRITTVIIIIFFHLSNCILINQTSTSVDRIKGKDAGAMIINAAVTTDFINTIVLYGKPYISVTSLLADIITGINSDDYYIKSEVKNCVNAINGISGFLIGSLFTLYIIDECNITPDHQLIDIPLLEL